MELISVSSKGEILVFINRTIESASLMDCGIFLPSNWTSAQKPLLVYSFGVFIISSHPDLQKIVKLETSTKQKVGVGIPNKEASVHDESTMSPYTFVSSLCLFFKFHLTIVIMLSISCILQRNFN